MNESVITHYITSAFGDVHVADTWGDSFFYYNPDSSQPDEVYFATLKSGDDDYDNQSNLNRPGVFRLNMGLSKPTYESLFGAAPSRHNAQSMEETGNYDYAAFDQLLPHPVYAHMNWVCILNPSAETFRTLQPLLEDAYALAVSRVAKQQARSGKKEG
jgi:hypothetical protein